MFYRVLLRTTVVFSVPLDYGTHEAEVVSLGKGSQAPDSAHFWRTSYPRGAQVAGSQWFKAEVRSALPGHGTRSSMEARALCVRGSSTPVPIVFDS